MKRAELYRVRQAQRGDPKKSRVVVVVSRQVLIDSGFSSVICAPIYSSYHALSSEVLVGADEGLKHECSIHCDGLMSLPKSLLADFVGMLGPQKIEDLNNALQVSLGLR